MIRTAPSLFPIRSATLDKRGAVSSSATHGRSASNSFKCPCLSQVSRRALVARSMMRRAHSRSKSFSQRGVNEAPPAPLPAVLPGPLVREEVLQRREEEVAELPLRRVEVGEEVAAHQVGQELLGRVLCILARKPPAPEERIERRPVDREELIQLLAHVLGGPPLRGAEEDPTRQWKTDMHRCSVSSGLLTHDLEDSGRLQALQGAGRGGALSREGKARCRQPRTATHAVPTPVAARAGGGYRPGFEIARKPSGFPVSPSDPR